MADEFGHFLSFFLISPVLAIFFGFFFWLAAVVVTKGAAARIGANLLLFLGTGYAIIGLFALFLLVRGDDAGKTQYGAGPILGVLASFGVLVLVWRKLGGKIKTRWASKRSRGGPPGGILGGPPPPYGAVDPRTGQYISHPGPSHPGPPGGQPHYGGQPYGNQPQFGGQSPYGTQAGQAPAGPAGWDSGWPRPVARPPGREPQPPPPPPSAPPRGGHPPEGGPGRRNEPGSPDGPPLDDLGLDDLDDL